MEVRPCSLGASARQHPQVAGEAGRLVRVIAPAQFQVALDDVRIAEFAGEVAGVLVQDPGLLAAGGGAEDPRPLDGDQVVRAPTSAIKAVLPWPRGAGPRLALGAADRPPDPALKRLDRDAACGGEVSNVGAATHARKWPRPLLDRLLASGLLGRVEAAAIVGALLAAARAQLRRSAGGRLRDHPAAVLATPDRSFRHVSKSGAVLGRDAESNHGSDQTT